MSVSASRDPGVSMTMKRPNLARRVAAAHFAAGLALLASETRAHAEPTPPSSPPAASEPAPSDAWGRAIQRGAKQEGTKNEAEDAGSEAKLPKELPGPGFVQANVLGFSAAISGGSGLAYPLEISGGYHINGAHEGLVLGGAQKLIFSGGMIAATVVRVGFDLAIPVQEMDLVVAPYGYGGVAYGAPVGGVLAHFGFGAEGRFFPIKRGPGKGFFAVARPFEVGFIPAIGGTLVFYTFSAGAGFAF